MLALSKPLIFPANNTTPRARFAVTFLKPYGKAAVIAQSLFLGHYLIEFESSIPFSISNSATPALKFEVADS